MLLLRSASIGKMSLFDIFCCRCRVLSELNIGSIVYVLTRALKRVHKFVSSMLNKLPCFGRLDSLRETMLRITLF